MANIGEIVREVWSQPIELPEGIREPQAIPVEPWTEEEEPRIPVEPAPEKVPVEI